MERAAAERDSQSRHGGQLGAWVVDSLRWAVWISAPWLHVKLLLVVGPCRPSTACWRVGPPTLAADRNRHSERFYRIVNEVPAVLMVGIVIMDGDQAVLIA